MNPLQTFYSNESQREAVKVFMIEILREMAADEAFETGNTDGYKEARVCVDKAFDRLEELYGIVKPVVIKNSR